ncbi:chlorophyll A/B binding protein of LHCII type 1-like protein, partial [Tanacetum coccineum]
GNSNGELVKMGKASRNKGQNINKLTPPPPIKIEGNSPLSSPQPIYHPLSQKQKEKIKEVLDKNEEDRMRIIEHGLPKKMCDPGNFVLPVSVNGTVQMNALADTGASVSVLPFNLYKNLGLSDPRPYHSNLTMADNTQAKVMGEVRNVGIQIGANAYMENFEIDEEDDWLSCFEVGRDEDGNHKHGPVAPSFLDIEDEMGRALAMEAYFNPFKNIIDFKKLNDFLGSLPVQLKNTDWGNEGYEMYNKIEGDEAWHAKF